MSDHELLMELAGFVVSQCQTCHGRGEYLPDWHHVGDEGKYVECQDCTPLRNAMAKA